MHRLQPHCTQIRQHHRGGSFLRRWGKASSQRTPGASAMHSRKVLGNLLRKDLEGKNARGPLERWSIVHWCQGVCVLLEELRVPQPAELVRRTQGKNEQAPRGLPSLRLVVPEAAESEFLFLRAQALKVQSSVLREKAKLEALAHEFRRKAAAGLAL
ncbi:hypothetical protein SVAN01_09401 [Stagonosporopsis vannaccii]|nr:hypothetical protein SVAN01_09401 [Stagonosporopsis vannaccii]